MKIRHFAKVIFVLIMIISVFGCEFVVNPEVVVNVNNVAFDFGTVDVGNFNDEILILTNGGDNPLVIYTAQFQNYGATTTPGEFVVVSGWSGNAVEINPSQSHSITMRFAPTSAGAKSVQVEIARPVPAEGEATRIPLPVFAAPDPREIRSTK